jgi:hypothetical protein
MTVSRSLKLICHDRACFGTAFFAFFTLPA